VTGGYDKKLAKLLGLPLPVDDGCQKTARHFHHQIAARAARQIVDRCTFRNEPNPIVDRHRFRRALVQDHQVSGKTLTRARGRRGGLRYRQQRHERQARDRDDPE
jgi:dihydroxyacid dehydratase/phosphogluconate dehydratase